MPQHCGGTPGAVRECCFGQTTWRLYTPYQNSLQRTLYLLSCSAGYSFLRPILASSMKLNMYRGWRKAALRHCPATRLTCSSPYSHRPLLGSLPRYQPRSLACCSAQASAGHHRIGGVPFRLLCRRYRNDNSPHLCQRQGEVHTLLPRPRGHTNPRLPEHCVTIHHPSGSIRAPRVVDSVQPSGGCLYVQVACT